MIFNQINEYIKINGLFSEILKDFKKIIIQND